MIISHFVKDRKIFFSINGDYFIKLLPKIRKNFALNGTSAKCCSTKKRKTQRINT